MRRQHGTVEGNSTIDAGEIRDWGQGGEEKASMTRVVDDLDRSIIQRLQRDGRMSSARIARQLGVAERTVRARIDRLVADNVIRLVATVVPSTVGFAVTADVFLEIEAGRVHEIAHKIAARPEVGYVGLSTGERDISIQIHAQSVEQLYDFVSNELGNLSGVVRTNTFIIPKIIKNHFDFVGPDMLVEDSDEQPMDTESDTTLQPGSMVDSAE